MPTKEEIKMLTWESELYVSTAKDKRIRLDNGHYYHIIFQTIQPRSRHARASDTIEHLYMPLNYPDDLDIKSTLNIKGLKDLHISGSDVQIHRVGDPSQGQRSKPLRSAKPFFTWQHTLFQKLSSNGKVFGYIQGFLEKKIVLYVATDFIIFTDKQLFQVVLAARPEVPSDVPYEIIRALEPIND